MGGSKEDYLAANSVLNLQYTMLKRFHKKLNSLSSTLKRAGQLNEEKPLLSGFSITSRNRLELIYGIFCPLSYKLSQEF